MPSGTTTALIVAAGRGARLGGDVPKQYRLLGGKPLLRRAVEALINHPRIDGVRVVIGPGQQEVARAALRDLDVGDLIEGAEERAFSVINGVEALRGRTKYLLVHDAARPFCPPQVVNRLLDAVQFHDAAIPVLPAVDTLTKVTAQGALGEAIDRAQVYRVQTPQAFSLERLVEAYRDWHSSPPTDEASYFRAKGIAVATVDGDPVLEKLTTTEDWSRAEALLASRMIPRTGMGFDVHAFGGDGPVMLGGIAVPHSRGLAGHSDADVVLHAITDALLGAASLGDIGEHFPPSDPQWKGASSDRFLRRAASLIREQGGIIDHVDCTIIGEEPKVSPHRSAIRDRVAEILGLAARQVSVKATTTEGLGFTGRREGLAAQAVANIRMEPSV